MHGLKLTVAKGLMSMLSLKRRTKFAAFLTKIENHLNKMAKKIKKLMNFSLINYKKKSL